jgi:hypothetical protein
MFWVMGLVCKSTIILMFRPWLEYQDYCYHVIDSDDTLCIDW